MLKSERDDDELTLPGMPELPEPPPEPPYDELAALAVQLRCEHCRVMPGHWCRTRAGHGAANLHAARWLVVQAVYWLGYEQGTAQAGRTVAKIIGESA